MNKIICLLLTFLFFGCATSVETLKGASAGPTGCAPQSIEIANHQKSGGTETWQATCSGKKYICTGFGYNVNCSAPK